MTCNWPWQSRPYRSVQMSPDGSAGFDQVLAAPRALGDGNLQRSPAGQTGSSRTGSGISNLLLLSMLQALEVPRLGTSTAVRMTSQVGLGFNALQASSSLANARYRGSFQPFNVSAEK